MYGIVARRNSGRGRLDGSPGRCCVYNVPLPLGSEGGILSDTLFLAVFPLRHSETKEAGRRNYRSVHAQARPSGWCLSRTHASMMTMGRRVWRQALFLAFHPFIATLSRLQMAANSRNVTRCNPFLWCHRWISLPPFDLNAAKVTSGTTKKRVPL